MKTEKQTENTGKDFQDRAAERIAGFILQIQERIASFLNRKVSGLSSSILKSYLFLFCLIFGLACLWVVLSTVWFPTQIISESHTEQNIGRPSERYQDTIHPPSVNTKK